MMNTDESSKFYDTKELHEPAQLSPTQFGIMSQNSSDRMMRLVQVRCYGYSMMAVASREN